MLCATEDKYIRLGSLMKYCLTLESCLHSSGKRIDRHEGDDKGGVVLRSEPAWGESEQHFSPTLHPFQLRAHLCF